MIRYQLPPKRFQQVDDPRYDQIRTRKWFSKLTRRRKKLDKLKLAFLMWNECGDRQASAKHFGVHNWELQKYTEFMLSKPSSKVEPKLLRAYQEILNEAYQLYCSEAAKHHIRDYVIDVCPKWGMSAHAKMICELWEVDSTLFPVGYEP